MEEKKDDAPAQKKPSAKAKKSRRNNMRAMIAAMKKQGGGGGFGALEIAGGNDSDGDSPPKPKKKDKPKKAPKKKPKKNKPKPKPKAKPKPKPKPIIPSESESDSPEPPPKPKPKPKPKKGKTKTALVTPSKKNDKKSKLKKGRTVSALNEPSSKKNKLKKGKTQSNVKKAKKSDDTGYKMTAMAARGDRPKKKKHMSIRELRKQGNKKAEPAAGSGNPLEACNGEWFDTAKGADKWKDKFECMKEIMEIACGDAFGNGKLPDKFDDDKKAPDVLNMMAKWIRDERHIFTRQHILKLLVPMSKSYPKKAWSKNANKFADGIIMNQWSEKKPGFNQYVTPALLGVYKASGAKLSKWREYLVDAMKSPVGQVRRCVWDFLGKCCMIGGTKDVKSFVSGNIADILKDTIINDKEKDVRAACARLIYGAKLRSVQKDCETDKRATVAIEEAEWGYNREQKLLNGEQVEEKGDDAPPKKTNKAGSKSRKNNMRAMIAAMKKQGGGGGFGALEIAGGNDAGNDDDDDSDPPPKKSKKAAKKKDKRGGGMRSQIAAMKKGKKPKKKIELLPESSSEDEPPPPPKKKKSPNKSNGDDSGGKKKGKKKHMSIREQMKMMKKQGGGSDEASSDPIAALSLDWMKRAQNAETWKDKYECMQELVENACGDPQGNAEFKDSYDDNDKAGDVLLYMSKWLENEQHIFTRQLILKILVPFSNSYPAKAWKKPGSKMISSMIMTQWAEAKTGFLQYVTPALLKVYMCSGYPLTKFKGQLLEAMKHPVGQVRMSVWLFFTEVVKLGQTKDLNKLINNEIGEILVKTAKEDKDVKARGAAKEFLNEGNNSLKGNKAFKKAYGEVNKKKGKKNDKNSRKAAMRARIAAMKKQAAKQGAKGGEIEIGVTKGTGVANPQSNDSDNDNDNDNYEQKSESPPPREITPPPKKPIKPAKKKSKYNDSDDDDSDSDSDDSNDNTNNTKKSNTRGNARVDSDSDSDAPPNETPYQRVKRQKREAAERERKREEDLRKQREIERQEEIARKKQEALENENNVPNETPYQRIKREKREAAERKKKQEEERKRQRELDKQRERERREQAIRERDEREEQERLAKEREREERRKQKELERQERERQRELDKQKKKKNGGGFFRKLSKRLGKSDLPPNSDDDNDNNNNNSDDKICEIVKVGDSSERILRLFKDLSEYLTYSERSDSNRGLKVDVVKDNKYGKALSSKHDIKSFDGWCIVKIDDINIYGMKYDKIVNKILPELEDSYEITFYNSAQIREQQQKKKAKGATKSRYEDSDDDDDDDDDDDNDDGDQICELVNDDEENEKTLRLYYTFSKYFTFSTRSAKNKGYKVDELNDDEYGDAIKKFGVESYGGWCIVAINDTNVYGMKPKNIDDMVKNTNISNGFNVTFYQSQKLKQQQQEEQRNNRNSNNNNNGYSKASSKSKSKKKGNDGVEFVSKEGDEEVVLKFYKSISTFFTVSSRNAGGRGLKVDEVLLDIISDEYGVKSYNGWCIVSIDGTNIYGMKKDKIESKIISNLSFSDGYELTFYCSSKLKQQQQEQLKQKMADIEREQNEQRKREMINNSNSDTILLEDKGKRNKVIRVKGNIRDILTWNSGTGGKGIIIESINSNNDCGSELRDLYGIGDGWAIISLNGKDVSNKKFGNIKMILRGLDKSGYDIEFLNKNSGGNNNNNNDDDDDDDEEKVIKLISDNSDNDKEFKIWPALHNFIMFASRDGGIGMVVKKVFEYNEHGSKLRKFGIESGNDWYISEIDREDVTDMSFIDIKAKLYGKYKKKTGYTIRFVKESGNSFSIKKSRTNLATSDSDSDEDTRSVICDIVKNKSNKKIITLYFDITQYIEYETRYKKRGFKIIKISKKNKYGKQLLNKVGLPKHGGWYISKIDDIDVSNQKIKKIISLIDDVSSNSNGYTITLLPCDDDSSSDDDDNNNNINHPPPADPNVLKSIPKKKKYKAPSMDPINGFAVSNDSIRANDQPMKTKHAKVQSKLKSNKYIDSDSE